MDFYHNLAYDDTPIVMSGGIFSNIDTFDSFGRELVDDGYDVWLIEMNGGPETDCTELEEGEEDTCPNYTFHVFPKSNA